MVTRIPYYNEISGASYHGPIVNVEADSIGVNRVVLLNTSFAGNVFLQPGFFLPPGFGFVLQGNAQEINMGKFVFQLQSLPGPVPYRFCLIKKKYI